MFLGGAAKQKSGKNNAIKRCLHIEYLLALLGLLVEFLGKINTILSKIKRNIALYVGKK